MPCVLNDPAADSRTRSGSDRARTASSAPRLPLHVRVCAAPARHVRDRHHDRDVQTFHPPGLPPGSSPRPRLVF